MVAFTSVAVVAVISGPAYAACSKPDIPACAVQKGAFPREADFDACRMQMLAYKDAIERQAACVKEEGRPQEDKSSEEELQTTLAAFNRRARGE